ncbi:hypothetical protein GCM10019016_098390 [Streptomyces prasinosporus]|uniref:Transposase n=1 Tax=Streptomyces prasinosporus TaxID=68256 RepID=A0ABP6U6W9_9ACTN
MLVIAEVVGDPAFESGLQQPLGQLLEQSALAGQLQALGLGPAHQLVDQLVGHGLGRHSRCRLAGLVLGHVPTGHRRIFHDRELYRAIYSPRDVRQQQQRLDCWPVLVDLERGDVRFVTLDERHLWKNPST